MLAPVTVTGTFQARLVVFKVAEKQARWNTMRLVVKNLSANPVHAIALYCTLCVLCVVYTE